MWGVECVLEREKGREEMLMRAAGREKAELGGKRCLFGNRIAAIIQNCSAFVSIKERLLNVALTLTLTLALDVVRG